MITSAGSVVPVLDVGGTHVTGALVDMSALRVLDGTLHRLPLAADAPADGILASIAECAQLVMHSVVVAGLAVGSGTIQAPIWGVAMPDPFDYPHGIALFDGVGKFESLYGVDVGAALLARLPSTSAAGFAFLNDADAFTLGEWAAGAGRGSRRCVGITLGTGIGSGWLDDGRIMGTEGSLPSTDVAPGGRAHRIELDGAGLEETVSRRAIRRAYRERTGDEADVREICERARGGEAAARSILDVAMTGLGRALAPYLIAFAPQVVVIGGSMAASWDLFEPSVRRGYDAIAATDSAAPQPAATQDPIFAVSAEAEQSALIGAARFVSTRS